MEQLEPRILLSGDGLLYPAADPLLADTQMVVQYAELLNTTEQVAQQLSAEGPEFAAEMKDFTESLQSLGPSPIRKLRGEAHAA